MCDTLPKRGDAARESTAGYGPGGDADASDRNFARTVIFSYPGTTTKARSGRV